MRFSCVLVIVSDIQGLWTLWTLWTKLLEKSFGSSHYIGFQPYERQ